MDWKLAFEIAYRVLEFALVLVILPVLAVLLFFGRIGNRGSAKVISDGRIEFPSCRVAFWSMLLAVAYVAQEAVRHLIRGYWSAWSLYTEGIVVAGAFLLLSMLPATIIVTDNGLEQVYWLRKNRRILWSDIEQIETDKKGRTVTITGADGTMIHHTGQQVDCPRLLFEIRRHCGDNLPPDFPREPLSD